MSMSTSYVPMMEKIYQVASLILDYSNLNDADSVFIESKILFQNFTWLTESELKNILDNLQKEEVIQYEWWGKEEQALYERSIPRDGTMPDFDPDSYYGGEFVNARTSPKENKENQSDFIGIRFNPDIEKLTNYIHQNKPSRNTTSNTVDEQMPPDSDCLILDKNISLRHKGDINGFHYDLGKGWFLAKLAPLQVRILLHLYHCKQSTGCTRGKKASELAAVLTNQKTNKPSTPRSIQTHIRNINLASTSRGLPEIITHISKSIWGINQEFSCVRDRQNP